MVTQKSMYFGACAPLMPRRSSSRLQGQLQQHCIIQSWTSLWPKSCLTWEHSSYICYQHIFKTCRYLQESFLAHSTIFDCIAIWLCHIWAMPTTKLVSHSAPQSGRWDGERSSQQWFHLLNKNWHDVWWHISVQVRLLPTATTHAHQAKQQADIQF